MERAIRCPRATVSLYARPLTSEQQSLLETLHREHCGWMIAEAIDKGLEDPAPPVSAALMRTAIKYDRNKGSSLALLRKIFWNELAGAYRTQIDEIGHLLPLPAGYDQIPAEEHAEGEEDREELARRLNQLRAAVELLPRQYRDIIKHRYYEE